MNTLDFDSFKIKDHKEYFVYSRLDPCISLGRFLRTKNVSLYSSYTLAEMELLNNSLYS